MTQESWILSPGLAYQASVGEFGPGRDERTRNEERTTLLAARAGAPDGAKHTGPPGRTRTCTMRLRTPLPDPSGSREGKRTEFSKVEDAPARCEREAGMRKRETETSPKTNEPPERGLGRLAGAKNA